MIIVTARNERRNSASPSVQKGQPRFVYSVSLYSGHTRVRTYIQTWNPKDAMEYAGIARLVRAVEERECEEAAS